MRVAVFGASGFVGSTLVEQLWADGQTDVRPVIHSSGNAARLARHGLPLVTADLMAPQTLEQVVDGCTHVVNCSRGPAEVMTRGLQNLLDVAKKKGVRRFVHLSSVAVYGETDIAVLDEGATPQPTPNTYGYMKLLQDQLVKKAAQAGMSAVVLCPPNISGPHSAYLLEVLDTIRRGRLGLVDGGRQSCELVDVGNLVHAIRLGLTAGASDAERIFVTDGAPVTWLEVASALQQLADSPGPLPTIPLENARALAATSEPPSPAIGRAVRHLVSSEVRQALKRDPWLALAEKRLKTAVKRVPALDKMLRRRFADRPAIRKASQGPALSDRLLKQQLRGVTYSQARAQRMLGYAPVLNFPASMANFAAWYRLHYGWGDEWSTLLQHLRAKG